MTSITENNDLKDTKKTKKEEKDEATTPSTTEKKDKKIIKKETEKKEDNEKIHELTNLLQRLQADFENYKKQVGQQRKDYETIIKIEFIKKMLPILDSFELALKNHQNHEKFVKGVELIFAQLYSTLENEGLRPITATGKFDPYKHEVLLKEDSDKEDDTILEELQKGYMMKGVVIRHSKVKVAKKK